MRFPAKSKKMRKNAHFCSDIGLFPLFLLKKLIYMF
jgi:hypothetical protein